MSFDYYAFLAENTSSTKKMNEAGLASGFVDGCTVWSCRDKPPDKKVPDPKNEARIYYMKQPAEPELKLPPKLNLEPDHVPLLHSTWFGIDVSFTLASPWYSKDDRPFHVLDNPLRKDRIFGVPFMSAASWKGLLRWACRMQAGLCDHLEKHGMKMNDWKDPSWIVHLFGNEKGEKNEFQAGALVFYPTWFNKVGFEVINPHSRARRAGTQPIYYEVVPAGTEGKLRLLYAPLPGHIEKNTPADFIKNLIESIQTLLETYGISAKRTAGWGTARIDNKESKLWFVKSSWLDEVVGGGIKDELTEPLPEKFKKLFDEDGDPISILLDEKGEFLSKTQFKKIEGGKPCTNNEFEDFKRWYEKNGESYKRSLKTNQDHTPLIKTKKIPFDNFLSTLKSRLTQKEGDR
jgi:CRISPR-associated protein Cmr2